MMNNKKFSIYIDKNNVLHLVCQNRMALIKDLKLVVGNWDQRSIEMNKLFPQAVSFEVFWDNYHKITGQQKRDIGGAKKYFDRLSPKEKKIANEKIKDYYNSLSEKKYCKMARRYLECKSFLDEFEDKTKPRWV